MKRKSYSFCLAPAVSVFSSRFIGHKISFFGSGGFSSSSSLFLCIFRIRVLLGVVWGS